MSNSLNFHGDITQLLRPTCLLFNDVKIRWILELFLTSEWFQYELVTEDSWQKNAAIIRCGTVIEANCSRDWS